MFGTMEAQCFCGTAAKGRARDVLRLLEGHNCPGAQETELETETHIGFRPNPREEEDE